MNKKQIKTILTDIRFWIVVLFLLRLVGITHAPLEISHNWRQALSNMIARNFLEDGANILYPKIDMAGNLTGIIGSEFPFFNYLIYLFASIFDYSHWYGRLINLTVSSIGLYYFFALIKNLFNKQIAFNSTIILCTSICFAFSRKIMPDTFSVSLMIIALYHAAGYLKNGKNRGLFLFFLFSTLGMLCKIPALSLFSVLGIVFFIQSIAVQKKLKLFLVGSISFALTCLWYFYWVPHLLNHYHYQLYFPKGIFEGFYEITPLIPELLKRFYFSSLQSYLAFVACLVGLFYMLKNNNKYHLISLGIVTFVFFIFILKTGAVFPLHDYYIIPFTPILALLAGYALDKIPVKYQYILLSLMAIEGIANQQHDFKIKDSKRYKLELEGITQAHIPRDDLIIINGGASPQDIYFANRKGWTVDQKAISQKHVVDSLQNLGAKYLIVDKTKKEDYSSSQTKIFANEHYLVYQLQNP